MICGGLAILYYDFTYFLQCVSDSFVEQLCRSLYWIHLSEKSFAGGSPEYVTEGVFAGL